MSSVCSSAESTASTVVGLMSCPPSTRSASSSTTALACSTWSSSPSIVSRFPRSTIVHRSRSRRAPSTPSPIVASSAATSFETEKTSCTGPQCRDRHRPLARAGFGPGAEARGARLGRGSGELLAHELADDRAVGASRDLRHHVRHDAAEVAHARRADLCDRVVDDLLELVLGERLGHELLEHCQLSLFSKRLLLAATAPEGLRRLEPALALALEHL